MKRLLAILMVGTCLLFPAVAAAAPPPFELVQKSVAKHRESGRVSLDLRVTQMHGELREFDLAGTYAYGDEVASLNTGDFALRLLWIALLAKDPVAELQRKATFVNQRQATVGVQDGFVYVYGSMPSASVYRDLKRVAALSTKRDGHTWIVRLAWQDEELTGVMVSRDGRTVLTARAKKSAPAKR